ncbi:MAG: sigma 54-interacting transcriptional regulator [Clostridiales bacterium]|nr:sigma 54-interacting transcriptional regulator [Clostridiales bacterium]MDD7034986.1 sigma 54-interacting transcriptional regulator [Bacillota bacterium]MDY2920253.1 sigma 54-interacting transcriptional regulator [Lentihominibacter sp.]
MAPYGLDRVVSPEQVFPASAWKLDNSRELRKGEMRVSLRRIHIEGTSFKQICHEAANDEELIREKIMDIVIKRGKLHNPVTDTGGLLYGVVEEIGTGYDNEKGFKVGDEVVCNASLAGTPLCINRITAIDKCYPQIEAEGYAIMLPGVPVVRKPEGIPADLLLFSLNESGTIYTVSKNAAGKKKFAVIGNNMLMNLLYGYTIRITAGEDAEIYCLFDRNTEVLLKGEKIDGLMKEVFNLVEYQNLLRPVACLKRFNTFPRMDMIVNCADIPGSETVSVIAAESGGTVIFANFISNYNIALYVTESIPKDLKILCADGYLEAYDEFDFRLVRELAPYVEGALVSRDKMKRKGYKSETEKQIFDHYNHYDISMAEGFVAVSDKMHNLLDEIMSVSKYDCNVLITGETGVGKEKVANIIQKNSGRKLQPFVKINCASIAPNLMESEFFGYEKGAFTGADSRGKKGYFEVADGGIIFLDEVGELPLDIQAKLLRVIQEGEFLRVGGTSPVKTDVRILSATNRDLEELVEQKTFRRDLYYRLNVFPLKVPALDERPEDIPPLVDSFINKYNDKFGVDKYIDEDAKNYLAGRNWPGNIRELENVIQRLMIASANDGITIIDVMKELEGDAVDTSRMESAQAISEGRDIDLTGAVEAYEKEMIRYACEKHGTTRKAAKALGISQTQLVRKKNKYGL